MLTVCSNILTATYEVRVWVSRAIKVAAFTVFTVANLTTAKLKNMGKS